VSYRLLFEMDAQHRGLVHIEGHRGKRAARRTRSGPCCASGLQRRRPTRCSTSDVRVVTLPGSPTGDAQEMTWSISSSASPWASCSTQIVDNDLVNLDFR
jgi:hypothetical protein